VANLLLREDAKTYDEPQNRGFLEDAANVSGVHGEILPRATYYSPRETLTAAIRAPS
jgi:hypothetical protein